MPLNHSEIYPDTLKYLLILDCTLAIFPSPPPFPVRGGGVKCLFDTILFPSPLRERVRVRDGLSD
jgi:hypothetical protein